MPKLKCGSSGSPSLAEVMEYTGLLQKYPIDRPLTEQEKQLQLHQKRRLDVEPIYQLSVIKMNSTFMEIVDKYYWDKGFLTASLLAGIAVGCAPSLWLFLDTVLTLLGWMPGEDRSVNAIEFWNALGAFVVFTLGVGALAIWLLRKESFAYTHYPIRLNRKTRMVHVFRLDGSVLSVPWDKLHFNLGKCAAPRHWDIRGHVLDADGVTVRESFSLPVWGIGHYERDQLKRFWEFVRRYMEDGPKAVSDEVRFCLPIESKRESFMFGWHRTDYEVGALPIPLRIFMLVLYVVFYPGRWFAMKTSRIPQWPQEIDDQCRVEPGDPCVKDVQINPPEFR